MTIESATYISDLNASLPGASDLKSEGDDHIRLLKSTTKATFPAVAGAVTATHTELSYVHGVTSALQTQIDAKVGSSAVAGLASLTAPSFVSYALFPVTTNTVSGIVGASTATDTVTVDTNKLLQNYGLTWKLFSDATVGPTAALSGYGGIRMYVAGVQQLRINSGAASFAGSVSATSFSGALSGNISQFTNDAGYITATGAAAAGSLTGTTLASNVVSSSLTSVGNLSALTVTSPITGSVTGSAGSVPWTGITGKPTVVSTATTSTAFTGTDTGNGSFITDVTVSISGSALTLNVARTYHTSPTGGNFA